MKLRSVLATAALIAALASGCSGSGDGDGDGEGGGSATGPIDSADVDRSATLRVGWTLAPRNMDPHTALGAGDYPFLSLVYDRLIDLSSDEQPVPMLATDWSFSEDGRALNMTLRDDVKFHDGTPFDADVVVANINRAKTLPTSTIVSTLAPIESVEAVSPTEVRFNLVAGRGAGLIYAFTERAGMMISPAGMEDAELGLHGAGSGPYVLEQESYRPATSGAFVRAPGEWWGPPEMASFDRIEMTAMLEEQTRLSALQSGQIDYAPLNPGSALGEQAQQLAESDAYDGAVIDTRTYFFAAFNPAAAPELQDQRVREAIVRGIDKDGLNEGVFGGACLPSTQMPLPGDSVYDESLEDAYTFDPEASRALLDEAGVDDLNLRAVLIGSEPMRSMNIALQAMYKDIGVDVDLSTGMNSADGIPAWARGDFQIHAYIAVGRPDPAAMYLEAQGRFMPGGPREGVDELFAPIDNPSLSDEERTSALQELNRAMVEEFGLVYICHPQVSVAARAGVVGLDQSPWTRYGAFSAQGLAITRD